MVSKEPLQPRTASPKEADWVTSLMTLGFADDPSCRYLYPDAEQYLTFFPEFVRLYGGDAFANGGAHVIDDVAAALWLGPGVHSDAAAIDDLLRRSVAPSALPELFEVYAKMEQGRPEEPHWFLPLIATDPLARGGGAGSALLEYGLAACDRDGLLAHLDSTHPKSIPLYERHGFEVQGAFTIGGHPTFYPMVRRARAAR